jgi:phosphopantothenoylcysteine decarboxylase/phosphopantothenate--cysteine ligase
MGYELARACQMAGADTVLISGPTQLQPPGDVEYVAVETTQQMFEAVSSRFDSCDCLIMAAAPADFTVAEPSSTKIKKAGSKLNLALKPTVDILAEMGGRKSGQLLVGFALETDNQLENARQKLIKKRLDLVVLNDPNEAGAGFDHDTNRVTIVGADMEAEELPLMSKSELAGRLVNVIRDLLRGLD